MTFLFFYERATPTGRIFLFKD